MVVKPARQTEVDTLVDVCFYTSVIPAAIPYAGYGFPIFQGDRRIVGVEVLFTMTVHPVILPGGIGNADGRDKVVIVSLIISVTPSPGSMALFRVGVRW